MGNTNKKNTIAAANQTIKADRGDTKKAAERTQGALADRHVRQHTPKNDNGRAK
ncbi:hypothetical protein [Streptomyces varsoviensis]|uniref:hypothetical protein n=1 Tax=Streptomyces varsoviensis TaxID=67373 RepID=UPI000A6D7553|nr:hypothetical protein [Streptomyces varsoviensis]